MFRLLQVGLALMVFATACTGSVATESAGATTTPTDIPVTSDGLAPTVTPAAEADASIDDGAQPAVALMLPDPGRWVVVEDWNDGADVDRVGKGLNQLQLDVAPLDQSGVPQLGQRISLVYRSGSADDFDRYWGDASSMGEPVDFEVAAGSGRSVRNTKVGFAMAVVESRGTVLSITAQHGAPDLTELAMSLELVDLDVWTAARDEAEAQRLLAIEAAMENVEIDTDPDEPLPHWVLPEPWKLKWVTDMTIWTPEQKAQAAAFSQASRPPGLPPSAPTGQEFWYFGIAETAELAAMRFAPDVTISVAIFDDPPDPFFPTNYPTISAFGLGGVISPVGGAGTRVELGSGHVRIIATTPKLKPEAVRDFLDALEYVSDDPLDGFVSSDPGVQVIDLVQRQDRPPSWHATWQRSGQLDVSVSVWRMGVADLRTWMLGRGATLDVPSDVWETVAADGVVDFGQGVTYDVPTGILVIPRGVDQSDLVPIGLEDWTALVEPVNADPIKPR